MPKGIDPIAENRHEMPYLDIVLGRISRILPRSTTTVLLFEYYSSIKYY